MQCVYIGNYVQICIAWTFMMEEKQSEGKRRKSTNGNPLIRTWTQQQRSRESEEQQKDVTDNYCEHVSIQYKHPCVLLRRRVTLKILCHLFSSFSSSKCQSVKNKHRGNRHFFSVYSTAIMPTGKIEILMKHIRQIEAVEALNCVSAYKCVGVGQCVCSRDTVGLSSERSQITWREHCYSLRHSAWSNNIIHSSLLPGLEQNGKRIHCWPTNHIQKKKVHAPDWCSLPNHS